MTRLRTAAVLFLVAGGATGVYAQAKRTKRPAAEKPAAEKTPEPEAAPTPAHLKGKTNKRPETAGPSVPKADAANYFYEFTRPGFAYSRIRIEHDENGLGKIWFQKDGSEEVWDDPIALSGPTMESVRSSLTDLDYLNSTESYQHERDYSNLGNVTFKYKKDGRERTVKYNWTSNKAAKDLMDTYRRISNEYTWKFDIGVARDSQPLLTVDLVDVFVSYLNRGELADPTAMLPYLRTLSEDEHLPLMARNRLSESIRKIEKQKK